MLSLKLEFNDLEADSKNKNQDTTSSALPSRLPRALAKAEENDPFCTPDSEIVMKLQVSHQLSEQDLRTSDVEEQKIDSPN